MGSGASKAFDVPLARALLTGFLRDSSIDRDVRTRLASFTQELNRFKIDPTLENILTLVDARVNPSIIKEKAGAFVPEIGDLVKWRALAPQKRDEDVSKAFRNYIFRKCFVYDAPQVNKAQDFFNGLFSGIKNYFRLDEELKGAGQGFPRVPIFTTNFDNGFEQFCRREVVDFFDGYDHQGWGGMLFNHTLYGTDGYKTHFKIYKLHGTVRYVRNTDGNLDEITSLPSDGSITSNGRSAFPVLVYAESYQYTSNSPQLELMYLMKEQLMISNRVVVVGYSFNDPHILTVFREVLSSRDVVLIICDPNAHKIIDKKFREHRSNCIPVPVESSRLNPVRDFRRNGVPR